MGHERTEYDGASLYQFERATYLGGILDVEVRLFV